MAKAALVMSLGLSDLLQCISVVWKVRDMTPLQVSAKAAFYRFPLAGSFFFFLRLGSCVREDSPGTS